ncbi:MAG: hypothetical protein AB7S26_06125 [Sandaracinaceae bacterium]
MRGHDRAIAMVGILAVMGVGAPALAQTATVEVQTTPPPYQPAPQPQPQPYVQPYTQPAPYGQPGYGQPGYVQPAPQPQPHEETRMHLGLTISGAVMLGVSYLLHAAIVSPLAGCDFDTCHGEWNGFRYAGLIPLAGPWVQLAVRPGASDLDAWGPYLVIDGLLQTAGLTLLILGLTLRETVTVYSSRDGDFELAVLPSAGQNGGGLAAVGRF